MFGTFLKLDFWPSMGSSLVDVACALEKNVYSAAFGWNVLYISLGCLWSNASFRACVSLLIFYLDDVSIAVSGVLQPPTIFGLYCQFLRLRWSELAICIEMILHWEHSQDTDQTCSGNPAQAWSLTRQVSEALLSVVFDSRHPIPCALLPHQCFYLHVQG